MSNLTDAIKRWDSPRSEDVIRRIRSESGDVDLFVEAARLVADPMDELWFCKAHGYAIDRFDGLTPKECLYVGRPGDCEPVAALVVAAALTPGDTR